ncbi:two-component system, NarL family, sensor histidine kinase DegS [Marinococcus luteus]|uniref:Signal transduction histidine-protein kinase/phosphatase DegS n=1 Tax=Marinococcus luteus TaxID=1122204 RepID=A0A1H2UCG6_9BACI|nr:two-component system, NarL family, sensor histidine kinase DegS [Marinococcus luteus]
MALRNAADLDQIIEQMLQTVEKSKEEIFEISETSRKELHTLQDELKEIQEHISETIERSDQLEVEARVARNQLAEVSKRFRQFSDEEVQKVYEKANESQVNLAVVRQEEKRLRDRRDNIERRLIQLDETIERAETLVSQVGIVYNFLAGDLQDVGEFVENAREKHEFGLQIIEAQEDERKRVAREIHDGPAQTLAHVLLRSELVEKISREKSAEEAIQEFRELRVLIRSSLGEVRRIIYDLRPMAIDDLGLVPTLQKYLRHLEDNTGMVTEFTTKGKEARVAPNLEIGLFRIVQEAAQNAYKHAKPDLLRVQLEQRPTSITILIKDDGKGFDVDKERDKSFGLLGMRERVNALGGQLTIDSVVGQGTRVKVFVPVH